MSGIVDEDRTTVEKCNLQQLKQEPYEIVLKKWSAIYGPKSKSFCEKKLNITTALQEFWEHQIEVVEERQQALKDSITQMQSDAEKLEKSLQLEQNNLQFDPGTALVEVEGELWELLCKYKSILDKRVARYDSLIKKEIELCAVLDENPLFLSLSCDSLEKYPNIPGREDMEIFEKRINDLQAREDDLKLEMEEQKTLLQVLLKDCDIMPFTKVERAAALNDETEFPSTAQNLETLKESVEMYKNMKKSMMAEAQSLREDIIKISRQIMKDAESVNGFLSQYSGYSKSTISKLKERLEDLKKDRKRNLMDLILQRRTQLNDLWTLCCYSDGQRAEFRPYYADYYSEDILGQHELEVEKLEIFYNQNKKIFLLEKKYKEMRARLEEIASDTQRLFNNRGGILLQEEKERKTIEKKLPAIKAELVTLLNEYNARTGKDLTYFGSRMLDRLHDWEEEWEVMKENQQKVKLLQPNTPTHWLATPSSIPRIGVGAAAGTYALLHATSYAMQPSITCLTPTKTTLGNTNPSYESFQEHLEKSASKKKCHSSKENLNRAGVLQPRNLIMTDFKSDTIQNSQSASLD